MSLRFTSFIEYEEDDVEYNKICDEHKHLLETLPKGSGWSIQHLYNYNGFWIDEMLLKAILLLDTYFKSEPTDIVLASFMKSGTTWLKTLMFSTLNRDRDPKDVLVSKWHFMCKLRSKDLTPLSFDEAFELFCLGVSEFGPFWEHVLSYWRASLESPDKILFLRYEELKKQPEVVVNKKGVEKLGNFEVEKQSFFRKGEIGDWKNYLSEEMKDRIDGITKQKFQGSGLIGFNE
ncbi:hypothetical protein E3N88_35698 [Mikania micrantha]|uniref:Sulfotransferase n=1 Tax=Mikania micrantha TaxID=192012 RepID=A0A5N6M200_9ASTR|nr:hypothetical protein E3N88_35698 [Mikania micrantha]